MATQKIEEVKEDEQPKRTSLTLEKLRASARDDKQAEREEIDTILGIMHDYKDEDNEDYFREVVLCRALQKLCSGIFFPWLDQVTDANKVYFCKQEGAIEKLLSYIDSKYSPTIRYYAISSVWNFASSDELSRIVLELGAFELILKQLTSDDRDVVSACIGCMWGYLEFEDVQEQSMKLGVGDILARLASDINNVPRAEHTCLVGCLLCLAFNAKCRRYLVEREAAKSVIKVMEEITDDNMVRYVSVICLALLTLDKESEEQLLALGVLKLVQQFLHDLKPQDIAKLDEEQGMIWKFPRSFFPLLSSHHAPIRHLGAFIFATLSHTNVHKPLFKEEGLACELMAIRSATEDIVLQAYIKLAISNLLPLGLDAPSLLELSAYQVRHDIHQTAPDDSQATRSTYVEKVNLLPQHLHERFSFVSPV